MKRSIPSPLSHRSASHYTHLGPTHTDCPCFCSACDSLRFHWDVQWRLSIPSEPFNRIIFYTISNFRVHRILEAISWFSAHLHLHVGNDLCPLFPSMKPQTIQMSRKSENVISIIMSIYYFGQFTFIWRDIFTTGEFDGPVNLWRNCRGERRRTRAPSTRRWWGRWRTWVPLAERLSLRRSPQVSPAVPTHSLVYTIGFTLIDSLQSHSYVCSHVALKRWKFHGLWP